MIDEKVRKAHDEIARAESRRVSLFTVLAIVVVLVGSFALLKSYGIVGKVVSIPDNQRCSTLRNGSVSGILPVQAGQYVVGWTDFTTTPHFCANSVQNIPFPEPLNLLLLGDSCTAQDNKIQFTSGGITTTFPIACVDADYTIVDQSGRLARAACEGSNARLTATDCQCSFGGCAPVEAQNAAPAAPAPSPPSSQPFQPPPTVQPRPGAT